MNKPPLARSAARLVKRISDAWLMEGLARLTPPRARARPAGRHFILLAPAVHGSLGDAAMVTAAVSRIRERAPAARITLVVYAERERALEAGLGVETVSLHGYMGPLPRRGALRRLRDLLGDGTDFVILGADVLDGGYAESNSLRRLFLGVLARRQGLSATIAGFSFSDRATPRIRRFLRARCQDFRLICRDPRSAGRMTEVMGRPIPSSADLAFLLPLPEAPSAAAAVALSQAQDWRSEGRPVVALNINARAILSTHPDLDIERCCTALAEALVRVHAETGCALLLIPHDHRPGIADLGFLRMLRDAAGDALPTAMPEEPVRPGDVKLLCRQADLTITGRMHLGIASLGVETPALFYDYQGKVEGLLELMDLPGMKFTAEDILDPPAFARMIGDRLAEAPGLRPRIAASLPDIRRLSETNIDAFMQAS